MLPEGHPKLDKTEIKFNFLPADEAKRNQHIYKAFHGWLEGGLKSATVVPSPHISAEKGGLEGLNPALDKVKAGVSGTKIVVSL